MVQCARGRSVPAALAVVVGSCPWARGTLSTGVRQSAHAHSIAHAVYQYDGHAPGVKGSGGARDVARGSAA